jgi:hypothetical protein
MKLKKGFFDLKQGSMFVNEYLNSFIQLSRYTPDNINMDEKKQDMFLNGLNDDVQFHMASIYRDASRQGLGCVLMQDEES